MILATKLLNTKIIYINTFTSNISASTTGGFAQPKTPIEIVSMEIICALKSFTFAINFFDRGCTYNFCVQALLR